MRTSEDNDRLSQLDIMHSSLESRRADLLQQPEELERSLKRNNIERAGFAPVNTIPEEMLRNIFEYTYEGCIAHEGSTVEPKSKCDPLLLTHVCRRWRRTAIALPAIWTCLHLDRPAYLLDLFIARSMGRPLHIVHLSGSEPPTEQVALAIQHAPRWKSILSRPILPSVLHLLLPGRVELPLLEHVDVNNIRQPEHAVVSNPNLTSLSLIALEVSFAHCDLRGLRYLYLGSTVISSRELLDLSIAAPRLAHMTLSTLQYTVDDPGRMVSFPFLDRKSVV